MQRIFLTGATGYLGSKFVDLYDTQFDIFKVSRSGKPAVDLTDPVTVERAYNEFKPDYIIHLGADLNRDYTNTDDVTKTDPAIIETLIRLAKQRTTPFIYTSTEAVYGGKPDGGYTEADTRQPRSPYGKSKVICEDLLMHSGLPYLITRGHRYVGINKSFARPKQFPDTLRALQAGIPVQLDSKKVFSPVSINHFCEVFMYFIEHDADKQLLFNIGSDKALTYYDFIIDVTKILKLDTNLVQPNGEEAGWPANSSLNFDKLRSSDYPFVDYQQMLDTIRNEI